MTIESKMPAAQLEATLKTYLEGLTEMARDGDESDIWIKYAEKEQMMDENLMESGIYGMRLHRHAKSTSVTMGQSVYALNNLLNEGEGKEEISERKDSSVEVDSEIVPWKAAHTNVCKAFQKFCPSEEGLRMIMIPICHAMH